MNCIDAIEGTAKSIIGQLHDQCIQLKTDDSEYIQTVKSVIEGVGTFVQANREVANDPATVQTVLYSYAKSLWREYRHQDLKRAGTASNPSDSGALEEDDYYNYYYDYIYANNMYPT